MSKSRQDRKKEIERRPLARYQYRGFVVKEGRSGTWYATKDGEQFLAADDEDDCRSALDIIAAERREQNGRSS